jgi:transcription-repair coupling factor (superfamily II helicase)
VFNKKPNINPMTIIELIQSEPERYRFDGKQTLRIHCQSGELEDRFTQVENLLTRLTS